MSDLGDRDELRRYASNRLGTALAQKASPTLLRSLAAAPEPFADGHADYLRVMSDFHHRPDGFIVELHDDFVDATPDPTPGEMAPEWFAARRDRNTQFADGLADALSGTLRDDRSMVEDLWLVGSLRVRAPIGVLNQVAESKAVKTVDLPRLLRADEAAPPRGGGTNCESSYRAAVDAIHNAVGSDGNGVSIALLDGEAHTGHPALHGRVSLAHNFTTEGAGAFSAHATAMAGLVLGTASVPGVAPSASLLNYKVLPTAGFQQDDATLTRALQQVIDDGVGLVICALSLAPAADQPERATRLLEAAAFANRVVCKSAGNTGPDVATLTDPSMGALVVGACDRAGTYVTQYSSRGPDRRNRAAPDVLAPGGEPFAGLWSARLDGGEGPVNEGTSNSAALVAGVFACILGGSSPEPLSGLRSRAAALAKPLPNVARFEQGLGALLVH